ncbi:AraC family transcriptional regulator [Psychrobacter sp. TAE2020]|uniref:AraC family transcriptional regulator n=1 Tax=Psychrobacter sp. TAE2020 TaxID=2846762 RepID=UPI001C1104A4|nr:AraC family transcriptional regulator [Psychrobacter sp. TAE2020]MBU5616833.1 AraC family transcriptional regulator [Psychrobacter sp. TAE2020]
MDALSVLLQEVHLIETKYHRLNGCGDWSYSFSRKDTIMFYLVLSGSFCIDLGHEVRQANTGDTIMIANATQHVSYALHHNGDNAKPLDDLLTIDDSDILQLNSGDVNNACLILIECQYDKQMIRPLLSVLPSMLPELGVKSDGRFGVMDVEVKLLALESEHQRMGKTAVINHWASIMMIECLRTYIESLPEATDSWLQAMKDPYLAKALAAMHDAPNNNWTIHRLAEVAGMSRSSFAQRFKDVVGMPPLTYLIDYRLRLAARYLRLQQNSISRISELVGYASDSTFSQAFKRVYGVSPKAYRQRYRHKLIS